ncbi:hypothetical protein AVEN_107599-1 [Araneus ventricosus]|uniref:Uncharacterized protein n=1 Tax=Araneus ventricosus TaxID=182803 RepID=A0A4Y2X6Z5_ARAVE|nr:hypothetical protein AVEN_107599-1 [Araneus ventricosus]
MSSDESQGTRRNRAEDSSEVDYDVERLPSSFGARSLDTNIETTEQQSRSRDESNRIQCEAATGSDISLSECKPLASAMEGNKLINQRAKDVQNFAEFLPQTTQCSSHSYEKPDNSNLSTPETKKDAFLNPASELKKKAGKSSSVARPAPFKEFALSSSDLPFTKQRLAESLSLEEACGFLPYLMKTKRTDLKGMENHLDQISVDLQIALRDAKNICILLENASKGVPKDINDAKVQAQKLMYLLSSSFRIFEKLDLCGSALKERIQVYSKQTGDYHSSVDILLEYIMENILEKCRQIERNF